MLMHLAEGTVRRYLDEPAAVSDADRDHLAGCERCQAELSRVRDDRDAVARALDVLGAPVRVADDAPDVALAWAELNRRLDEPAAAPAPGAPSEPAAVSAFGRRGAVASVAGPGRRGRPRMVEAVVRRPVAAVVVAGLVVLGGGAAAAAADWLPVFQTKKVTPVQVSAKDLAGVEQLAGQLNGLTELSAFGDLVAPSDVRPSAVPDAATAAARTGLTVPQVAKLPTGVEGVPTYQVVDRQSVQFTFSAAKAAQTAKARGVALPSMPAGLDGTTLRIEGGPGVAEIWGRPSGVPALVVARAKAPTAATQGASLDVIRNYLLSMPGISPQLAAQLRSVTGDGTTLPIPVPSDLATSSQAEVDGVQATVVETKNQFGVAVIWVNGGDLNVVLGPLSKSEVLAVARGLR